MSGNTNQASMPSGADRCDATVSQKVSDLRNKKAGSTRCADPTPKTFASMPQGYLREARDHVQADIAFRQLEAQKGQKPQ